MYALISMLFMSIWILSLNSNSGMKVSSFIKYILREGRKKIWCFVFSGGGRREKEVRGTSRALKLNARQGEHMS